MTAFCHAATPRGDDRRPTRSVVLASLAALLFLLGASGCSTTPAPVVTVSKAVWTPCPTTVPPRPAYATESLAGDEDLWRLWTAWSAERRQREAHEIDLRARLRGCVEQSEAREGHRADPR